MGMIMCSVIQQAMVSLRTWEALFPATFFRQMWREVLQDAFEGYTPRRRTMLFQINMKLYALNSVVNKVSARLSTTLILLVPVLFNNGCLTWVSSHLDHAPWTHDGCSANQCTAFKPADITKDNVNRLVVSWKYPSGDDGFYFFNPIIVDSIMYVM